MLNRFHKVTALMIMVISFALAPARAEVTGIEELRIRSDREAILNVLRRYEAAFNARDVNARMALCLKTYHEYGFEEGQFVLAKDYYQTLRDVGNYWRGLSSLRYSLRPLEIMIDGPQAFVKAYTTHFARNDSHASIVYFCLVKIDRRWWIAWDSYDIIERYR